VPTNGLTSSTSAAGAAFAGPAKSIAANRRRLEIAAFPDGALFICIRIIDQRQGSKLLVNFILVASVFYQLISF
jgi:hypothetical protein